MIEEFLSKTENPHRLAPMSLIGVFTDEDSSLQLIPRAGTAYNCDFGLILEELLCVPNLEGLS